MCSDSDLRTSDQEIELAAELRRPLIVHCVRADGVLLDTLRAAAAASPGGGGLPPILVMHAFGGSPETARALLQLAAREGVAAYFGFSPRAAKLRRAAAVAGTAATATTRRGTRAATGATASWAARAAARRTWPASTARRRTR